MAFKIKPRFDATIAESGIWIDVTDTMDRNHGSFRCALIDKHTQRWKLSLARMEREEALNAKRNRILKEKGEPVEDNKVNFAAKLLVEMSLLDWKGIEDENGPVPFSKDKALELFSMDDMQFALEQVLDAAGDIRNYQPDTPEEGESLEELEAKIAEVQAEAEAVEPKAKAKKAE